MGEPLFIKCSLLFLFCRKFTFLCFLHIGSYGNPNNDPKISLPPSYLPSNTTLPAWAPPTSPTKPKSAKWHNKISDEVIELITSQICRQIGPSENLEGVRLSLGISQSETNAIR